MRGGGERRAVEIEATAARGVEAAGRRRAVEATTARGGGDGGARWRRTAERGGDERRRAKIRQHLPVNRSPPRGVDLFPVEGEGDARALCITSHRSRLMA